jgi:hypothetical protein
VSRRTHLRAAEYGAVELLQAALSALNQIPNRRLHHETCTSTYELVAAIEQHLKAADEEGGAP